MNMRTKFEVDSFTRSRDNRGYPKIWAVPGYAHTTFFLRNLYIYFYGLLFGSYRPSIVTVPVSLHVSEILPLFCSSTLLFPTHTSSLPKIFPCSPRSRWMACGIWRAKVLG